MIQHSTQIAMNVQSEDYNPIAEAHKARVTGATPLEVLANAAQTSAIRAELGSPLIPREATNADFLLHLTPRQQSQLAYLLEEKAHAGEPMTKLEHMAYERVKQMMLRNCCALAADPRNDKLKDRDVGVDNARYLGAFMLRTLPFKKSALLPPQKGRCASFTSKTRRGGNVNLRGLIGTCAGLDPSYSQYLRTIMDPFSYMGRIPDNTYDPAVVKRVKASTTITTGACPNLLLVPMNHSQCPRILVFATSLTTAGSAVAGRYYVCQVLYPGEDPAVSYNRTRFVSGAVMVDLAIADAGTNAITGNYIPVEVMEAPNLTTTNSDAAQSISMAGLDTNPIRIDQGIVALSSPKIRPLRASVGQPNALAVPGTGSYPSHSVSMDASRLFYFDSNSAGITTLGTGAAVAALTDVEALTYTPVNTAPFNLCGRVTFSATFPLNVTLVAESAARVTTWFRVTQVNVNYAGVPTTTTFDTGHREITVSSGSNAYTIPDISVDARETLNLGYDKTLVKVSFIVSHQTYVGATGAVITAGSDVRKNMEILSYENDDYTTNINMIFMTGLTAGMPFTITQVVNLEAVPNSELSAQVKVSSFTPPNMLEAQMVDAVFSDRDKSGARLFYPKYTYQKLISSGAMASATKPEKLIGYSAGFMSDIWNFFKPGLRALVPGASKMFTNLIGREDLDEPLTNLGIKAFSAGTVARCAGGKFPEDKANLPIDPMDELTIALTLGTPLTSLDSCKRVASVTNKLITIAARNLEESQNDAEHVKSRIEACHRAVESSKGNPETTAQCADAPPDGDEEDLSGLADLLNQGAAGPVGNTITIPDPQTNDSIAKFQASMTTGFLLGCHEVTASEIINTQGYFYSQVAFPTVVMKNMEAWTLRVGTAPNAGGIYAPVEGTPLYVSTLLTNSGPLVADAYQAVGENVLEAFRTAAYVTIAGPRGSRVDGIEGASFTAALALALRGVSCKEMVTGMILPGQAISAPGELKIKIVGSNALGLRLITAATNGLLALAKAGTANPPGAYEGGVLNPYRPISLVSTLSELVAVACAHSGVGNRSPTTGAMLLPTQAVQGEVRPGRQPPPAAKPKAPEIKDIVGDPATIDITPEEFASAGITVAKKLVVSPDVNSILDVALTLKSSKYYNPNKQVINLGDKFIKKRTLNKNMENTLLPNVDDKVVAYRKTYVDSSALTRAIQAYLKGFRETREKQEQKAAITQPARTKGPARIDATNLEFDEDI